MMAWLDNIEVWLAQHDLTLDLVSVWVLCIGCVVLSLVKLTSWWALHGQHDRTEVGRTLKWGKFGETIIWAALGSLYGMTLYAYYHDYDYGVWPRTVLRTLVVLGIMVAAMWGVRFVAALHEESWGHSDTDIRQAAREIEQDATAIRQQAREIQQDATERRQDARDRPEHDA